MHFYQVTFQVIKNGELERAETRLFNVGSSEDPQPRYGALKEEMKEEMKKGNPDDKFEVVMAPGGSVLLDEQEFLRRGGEIRRIVGKSYD